MVATDSLDVCGLENQGSNIPRLSIRLASEAERKIGFPNDACVHVALGSVQIMELRNCDTFNRHPIVGDLEGIRFCEVLDVVAS